MRLIDADELKDKARELIPNYHASVVMNLFDLIDNLADNMPTIDQAKCGKWVDHVRDYWCSECGGRVLKEQAKMLSRCPYCGAKMSKGDEEE